MNTEINSLRERFPNLVVSWIEICPHQQKVVKQRKKMSKYHPLGVYLAGIPTGTQEITITFERIERILNDRLPSSAQRYQAWWSNEVEGSHVQAHSWMDAGWVVNTLNIQNKWVRFRRKK